MKKAVGLGWRDLRELDADPVFRVLEEREDFGQLTESLRNIKPLD